MVRPRWQSLRPRSMRRWFWWDRAVASWAALNFALVLFDLSYVPLRAFWLQRNLYPLPSVPLSIPMPFLPDVTPWYDPVKGIEPHRDTTAYIAAFEEMDRSLLEEGISTERARRLRDRQLQLTDRMIDENPFLVSGNAGTLEKFKNRLRDRAGLDSAKDSAAALLADGRLEGQGWQEERRFWNDELIPLVAINYWRSIDESGQPTDRFWAIDLLLFQSVFLLDVLLRAWRLRRQLPGLSWRDALLRRWIDLPLFLPAWRLLRVVPVLERLSSSRMVNLEPLRAAVSRAVVALLALELFEVLALQLLDGVQQLVRSPIWPQRIRRMCSHQTVAINEEQELVELLRLWTPLILTRVGPRLAPEMEAVVGYALQRSFSGSVVPPGLRDVAPLLRVESSLSRRLAEGIVESLLDLGRSAADQMRLLDRKQEDLLQQFGDRFWEELASALEQGPVLERSQDLLGSFLEELKLTYIAQMSRSGIDNLMAELDDLSFTEPGPRDQESAG
ncbi:hypothetical protein EVJ50_03055 [Synechococcus sp. RSCCF101]|uniref:hypothetical protein n=1 Tax=Synechococcus sp. RSCCF101 TaxID=2511069 RepID=UPI001246D8C7|nr:hypothetical protein [Synechococcus sp. RSCCF101]QEY31382.1 hypothetical protein EVJ50_03055 [Synechococcus sp. RSCCF101]